MEVSEVWALWVEVKPALQALVALWFTTWAVRLVVESWLAKDGQLAMRQEIRDLVHVYKERTRMLGEQFRIMENRWAYAEFEAKRKEAARPKVAPVTDDAHVTPAARELLGRIHPIKRPPPPPEGA